MSDLTSKNVIDDGHMKRREQLCDTFDSLDELKKLLIEEGKIPENIVLDDITQWLSSQQEQRPYYYKVSKKWGKAMAGLCKMSAEFNFEIPEVKKLDTLFYIDFFLEENGGEMTKAQFLKKVADEGEDVELYGEAFDYMTFKGYLVRVLTLHVKQ